jgi:hypothetical protein
MFRYQKVAVERKDHLVAFWLCSRVQPAMSLSSVAPRQQFRIMFSGASTAHGSGVADAACFIQQPNKDCLLMTQNRRDGKASCPAG